MGDNGSQEQNQDINFRYPEEEYFMNESKSDVVFVIDGQRIPALKQQLMVGSVYFRSMFSGNYTETDKRVIEIKDTTYEAFKAIIWFLYSRKLSLKDNEDINETLVSDVLTLADEYQILRLKDKIMNYLNNLVAMDTLVCVSAIALTHKLEELDTKVKQFIDNNYKQLIAKDVSYLTQINSNTDGYLMSKMMPSVRKMANYPNQPDWTYWTACNGYHFNHY